jgi:hypothetical protein
MQRDSDCLVFLHITHVMILCNVPITDRAAIGNGLSQVCGWLCSVTKFLAFTAAIGDILPQ